MKVGQILCITHEATLLHDPNANMIISISDVVAYPPVSIQGFLKIKTVRHGSNYNPAGPTGALSEEIAHPTIYHRLSQLSVDI